MTPILLDMPADELFEIGREVRRHRFRFQRFIYFHGFPEGGPAGAALRAGIDMGLEFLYGPAVQLAVQPFGNLFKVFQTILMAAHMSSATYQAIL